MISQHICARVGQFSSFNAFYKEPSADFMRSRYREENVEEDRHLWRLVVDGRLLAVQILYILLSLLLLWELPMLSSEILQNTFNLISMRTEIQTTCILQYKSKTKLYFYSRYYLKKNNDIVRLKNKLNHNAVVKIR